MRTYRKVGSNSASITPERIRKLDSIGMVWDVFDSLWEQNYSAAVKYYIENGDLDVPVNYVTEDGIKLHLWLQAIKCTYRNKGLKRKLTNQQIYYQFVICLLRTKCILNSIVNGYSIFYLKSKKGL